GGGFVRSVSHQLKRPRDVLDVFITRGFALRIVARVVIAVRQTQTALDQLCNNLRGVFEILTRAKAKDRWDAMRMQIRELILKAEQIRDLRNALKFRLERLQTFSFNFLLVHA